MCSLLQVSRATCISPNRLTEIRDYSQTTFIGKFADIIGLLQLAITWYTIRQAGGQAHYYSRIGTLKQSVPVREQ